MDEALLRRVRGTASRDAARRLTLSYVVGLLLVAGLTVGAFWLVRSTLTAQHADAAVVNVAGRQRMLSQRIAKAALALSVDAEAGPLRPSFEEELRGALHAFRVGHEALREGDPALGVPPTRDPEAVGRLDALGPAYRGLAAAAGALLGGGPAEVHLPRLLAEQAEFLPAQDALVHRYAELARGKVAALESQHAALLWLTLGLLVAEGLFVFRPAAAAMRRQLRCLEEAGEVMSHEARHDALTGLPNRNALLAHLHRLLGAHADDPAEELAVCFLDFDHFKAINDGLGHEAGDRLLQGIAKRALGLRTGPGAGSLEAFRLGGDEFVLTLHGRGLGPGVMELAERALRSFAEPHDLAGQECVSTASIGVAVVDAGTPGPLTASELIRNADLAMLQAKAAGKARCLLFDEEMYRFAQRRRRLEADLRATLLGGGNGTGDGRGLRVRWLPACGVEDGAVHAVEARVHWDHPTAGRVPGPELLELAEAAGVVHPLGDWLFGAVAAEVERLVSAGAGAVPLPRVQLGVPRSEALHPGFLGRVEALQARCPALKHRLCLSFDEAGMTRDLSVFAGLIGRARELGVVTCIDNLSGSSSTLADLAKLKVDRIKLDREALAPSGRAASQSILVSRALVSFARGVGLGVTATAVDGPDRLADALDLGVDAVQGLHWGPPGDLAEVLGRGGHFSPLRRAA